MIQIWRQSRSIYSELNKYLYRVCTKIKAPASHKYCAKRLMVLKALFFLLLYPEGQQLQSQWRTATVLSSAHWIYCSTMYVHIHWDQSFFFNTKRWINQEIGINCFERCWKALFHVQDSSYIQQLSIPMAGLTLKTRVFAAVKANNLDKRCSVKVATHSFTLNFRV